MFGDSPCDLLMSAVLKSNTIEVTEVYERNVCPKIGSPKNGEVQKVTDNIIHAEVSKRQHEVFNIDSTITTSNEADKRKEKLNNLSKKRINWKNHCFIGGIIFK